MLMDTEFTLFLTHVGNLSTVKSNQRRFAPTPAHITGITCPHHRNTQTLRIGTSDLTHRIYARREQNDKELLARLNAADSVEALNIVKANERANIKKSIKRARKSLFGKYFIGMSEGDAHTHYAITYRIYLPIQVLIRELANGCINWRRGGNDSRILVDINGDDISHPISCASNESMREDAGCGMNMNNPVVHEIDKSSQGVAA